ACMFGPQISYTLMSVRCTLCGVWRTLLRTMYAVKRDSPGIGGQRRGAHGHTRDIDSGAPAPPEPGASAARCDRPRRCGRTRGTHYAHACRGARGRADG